ncbi:MAG: ferrous iron transport protein A [Candidatus Woesearchaeota archaeon]|nr:ferrous iron transport protein A [Candidatus Woesearchaeota archaeon]MDP6265466.1 ferrous iron transport protein A [Candidatus Woesearchaeota archaeon]MDP7322665.1 ferrous iron transport protein A [Candidatus Woesearchaeota archaeon]MDP7476642.1 ferrous iron transport protein A [Candidatus Woesearchaeota archaeon]
MLLSEVKSNQKVTITSIKSNTLKLHLLKMGLQVGGTIKICKKISNGPIVLIHNSQEIILGNENIKLIEVSVAHDSLP